MNNVVIFPSNKSLKETAHQFYVFTWDSHENVTKLNIRSYSVTDSPKIKFVGILQRQMLKNSTFINFIH